VSSKRVVKRLADLTSEEVSDLFLLTQNVEQIMESIQGVNSSTITLQDGANAGQTIAVRAKRKVKVIIIDRKFLTF
jgi:diadenosine tetraphosphate (Ap4A) HIT family hydrolase